jgi:hypothetical protein
MMAKYDKKRLSGDIERRKRSLPSLSNEQLKKEVSHTSKLLEYSLPLCLRKRAETIISSQSPTQIESETERFSYEAYWYQLLLDYEKQVAEEAKKRKIA